MAQDVFPVTGDPTDEELTPQAEFRDAFEKYLQSDLYKQRQQQLRQEALRQEQEQLQQGSSRREIRSATEAGHIEAGLRSIPEAALRAGQTIGAGIRKTGEFLEAQPAEFRPSPWSFQPATEEDPGLLSDALTYYGKKIRDVGSAIEDPLRKRADVISKKNAAARKEWDDLNLRPGVGAQITGQFMESAVASAPSMVAGFAASRLAAPVLGFAYRMTKDARKAKQVVDVAGHNILQLSRVTGVSGAEILKQAVANNQGLRSAIDTLRHTQGNAMKMAEALGLAGAAGAGAAQSLGMAYSEAYNSLIEDGISPEEASELAYVPAVLNGASTMLWVLAFGKTGVESTAALKMPKGMIKNKLKAVWDHFKWEANEEFLDQMTSTIMSKLSDNPDMTLEDAAMHGVTAYFFGGTLGAMVGGGMEAYMRGSPEAIAERARQEREAVQAGTEPDPRNVNIPIPTAEVTAEVNQTTQSRETQREQQQQIDEDALADRAIQLFAELQDRHRRGLATDEALTTAWNNLRAMGIELPGMETEAPPLVEPETEEAPAPIDHTTAPAMPTPEEVQQYTELMTGAFDPAATDEERRARWAGAEQLKNKYGGQDLRKIGNEVPVVPPIPSTAEELSETVAAQPDVNAAANSVVQQADSDAASETLKEGSGRAITTTPIVRVQDFLEKSVEELEEIARDANFPSGLSGLALSVGAHMHPSQGELFNKLKQRYEELKKATEAGEIPAGVVLEEWVADLNKVTFLGEIIRAAEGSDPKLAGIAGYKPPFKTPPQARAPTVAASNRSQFSRATALEIAGDLIKGGVETRGIVKQVATNLGVPQTWVLKVRANIKKNAATYPDLATGAEVAYGLIERGAEDKRLGVVQPAAVPSGDVPFLAGEKRTKVVVQQDIDEITKTINQLKQQVKQLDLLAKGVVQGDHPPQSYALKRKSLQESLSEARQDLTLYNREMKNLDRAIAKETKKIEAGPEPEVVTQKEVDDTLAAFVDKPELRAVNLKSKYGWSLKRANAVLSKMVDDGLVARPPKITGAFTLTGKSATPPSPALGAETNTTPPQPSATEEPMTQGQIDVEKAKLAEDVGVTDDVPDVVEITPPDATPETGITEAQRKIRAMRDEARKEMLRQINTEPDAFGPLSPRKLAIISKWVSLEIANGVLSFARIAEKAWKTVGDWAIPYLKEAYQQARERYFDPAKMDTDAVIDEVLKYASYINIDKDPASEDVVVKPNEQNLRASLPPLPDKYFFTQGVFGNAAVEKSLAQFFWSRLHALAKKLKDPFDTGVDIEPWIEEIVGIPSIETQEQLDALINIFGPGRIQRRDPGAVGSLTKPRLVGRWELKGSLKKLRGLAEFTPSGQERDFGPMAARRLFDDVLREFKIFFDANRHHYNPSQRDKAVINASLANIKDLTLSTWFGWRTDQMDKYAVARFNASAQSLALAVGRQLIRTEKDVGDVVQEYRDTLSRRYEAEKAGEWVVVQRNNEKLSVLKTAIEAATGEGVVSDSLIKDSSYQPNVLDAPVDFAVLNKEAQHVRIEKAKEPTKKSEQKIAAPMQLRSAMIEQELILRGADAWAFFRMQKLSRAELAYLTSMMDQLFPKDQPGAPGEVVDITPEMKKAAMEKATGAGYVPSPLEKPRTPRLYGAPQALPTGDRLYRRPTKLKSGIITVAVEHDNPVLIGLTKGDSTVMEISTPEEAATRDHLVVTYHGTYMGVHVFPDITTAKERSEVYATLALKPDNDFMPLPKKAARYRWGGVVQNDLDRLYKDIIQMKPSDLSPEEIDELMEVVDELEASDVSRSAIANFAWDTEHPEGRDVFKRDAKGNILGKDYTTTQPTFYRQMLNLRRFAVFSDTYIKDKAPHQRVRIPMLSPDIEIPVSMADNRDVVYSRYASKIADAVAMALANQIVRQKMHVRTGKIRRTHVSKEQTQTPLPSVGVKVKVPFNDSRVDGVITEIEMVTTTRTTGVGAPEVSKKRVVGGVRGRGVQVTEPVRLKTVKVNVPIYTVRIPDGKGTRFLRLQDDQVEILPVVTKSETRTTELIDPKIKGQADPDIFEGEPVKSRLFLGIGVRDFYASSYDEKYRAAIKRKLSEDYTIEDLWGILASIGVSRESLPENLRQAVRWKEDVKTYSDESASALEQARKKRDKARAGRIKNGLIEQIILKIQEIYKEIAKIDVARRRVKTSIEHNFLRAKELPAGSPERSYINKLEKDIREQQARPPAQEKFWEETEKSPGKVTEDMVPPRHPLKIMRWRLYLSNTFKGTKWQPSDGIQRKLTKVPLGEIVLRVDQTGAQEGETDTKEIRGVKTNAWASVVGNKVAIQVWHENNYLTIYEIDLNTLPDTARQEFTHVVPSSVTGGDPQEVRGFYLAPDIISNSVINANGNGRWVPSQKAREGSAKKYLSIDEFRMFFQEKINLDYSKASKQVIKGTTVGPVESAEMAPSVGESTLEDAAVVGPPDSGLDGGISWLINTLNKAGMVGKALVNELRSNRHRLDVDEDWQSFTARAVDEIMPNWRDDPDQTKVAETIQAIEAAVEMYRQNRLTAGGGMASAQVAGPLVADVDPALLNIEHKGKQQIRDAIANPRNGLSERVRTLALAFIDMMPEAMFRHLKFRMTSTQNEGLDARVVYGGSFSHALRLATVITGNPNSESVLEEIAHSFAEFLPDDLANEVEAHRMADIQDLLRSDALSDSSREFIRVLFENGGSMTSEQFVAHQRMDWLDMYPLINTDEYFAHHFTDAAKRGVPKAGVSKALNWAFGWFKQLVNTIRAWAGNIGIQRDQFFDDLLSRFSDGDFTVSVNGGYLHEVNRNQDLGNAVALTAAKVRRIAQFEGAQDPTGFGMALMGPNMSLRIIMQGIEAQMTAAGDEMTGLARRASALANNDEVTFAIYQLFGVPPVEFDAAVANLSDEMRKQSELGAMAALKYSEKKLARSKELAKKYADKVSSDEFLKLVQQANDMRSNLMNREAVSASIRSQLEAAVAAAVKVVEARQGSLTELTMAQRELNWYRAMLDYTVGAADLIQKMSDALAQTDVGSAFLMGSVTLTPDEVRMQYLATNPPATDLQVSADVQELAAWMLAREANLRYQMAAASFEKDQAILGGLPGFAARVASAIASKNPKAIRDMFKLTASRAGADAKMAFILANRNRKIRELLNRANSYAQAVTFGELLLNDPRFRAYYQSRSAAVGEYRIPISEKDIGEPRFGSNVRLPMPISKEDLTVTISSNFDEMSVEQLKATKSRDEIEEWLSNNPESIDAPFYKEWLQFLESFINGSTTNDYSKVFSTGFKWVDQAILKSLGIMDHLLRTKGNLITNMVFAPRRAWINSMMQMDKWSTKWHRLITDSVLDAARSHADDDVDLSSKGTASYDWFNKVGRELFALMNTGYDFKAGDTLPVSGIQVTEADIAAITMQVKAIDEAMEIDVTKGMTMYMPGRLVQDLFVPGASYLRKTTKTSKWMLPRRFSHDGMNFVRRYFNEGINKKDLQTKRSMIDARFQELVGSFLFDRHSDFTHDSPVSAFYPTLLEMVRDGRVTNMQQLEAAVDGWYVNQLAGMALTGQITLLGNEPSGAQHFYNEFDALMTNIHKRAIGDDDGKKADYVGGTKVEQENAFTLGRAVRIAPFYFYNYGMKSDEDMIGVKLNGSSYWTERIIQSYIEVKKIAENRLAVINEELKRMENQEGLSRSEATEKWNKKNKDLIRKGRETATLEDIQDMANSIDGMLEMVTEVYTQAGRFSKAETQKLNQVVGTTVGSVLVSLLTLARNLTQSGFAYNAQRMNRITNSWFYWYPMAGIEIAKQVLAASAFGIPMMLKNLPSVHVVKAGKELMKMAADLGSRNATRAAAIFSEKARKKLKLSKPMWAEHGLMALTELLADFTQNWAESLFKFAKHYKELNDAGYTIPVNLRAELTSLSRSPSTYGRTHRVQGKGDWSTVAMGTIALWEFWTQIGRTLLPRVGDVGANIAIFNVSMKGIDHLESHLRKRFERIRENLGPAVVQLGKRITPGDVVPTWWGESKDVTAVGMLEQWFGSAGIDLRRAVNKYWAELSAEPDKAKRNKIRFLTHEQATALSMVGIEELNQATPTNRPLRFKMGSGSRTMGALWGWRMNMLSVQEQLFGGARSPDVPVLNLKTGEIDRISYRTRARINRAVFAFMSLIAAGAGGQAGYEALARLIARFMMNAEQRSTRQVWERRNMKEAGQQTLSDASTIIPIVDIIAHYWLNDQPGRRSLGTDPFVVINQAKNVLGWGGMALNTGDLTYGLDNVSKSLMPGTKSIINYMPAFSGRVKAMNVQRLLARYGDREMLRQTGSFTGPVGVSTATELTPYTQRMINEAFNENYVELTRLFNEGVQLAMSTRNISEEDARRRLRDLYSARNPYTRAFKALPTEEERQDTLSRMSESERAEVVAGEELFRRGAQQIGARANFTREQSDRAVSSSSPSTMPAYRQMYRDRYPQRRNRLTPQARRLR